MPTHLPSPPGDPHRPKHGPTSLPPNWSSANQPHHPARAQARTRLLHQLVHQLEHGVAVAAPQHAGAHHHGRRLCRLEPRQEGRLVGQQLRERRRVRAQVLVLVRQVHRLAQHRHLRKPLKHAESKTKVLVRARGWASTASPSTSRLASCTCARVCCGFGLPGRPDVRRDPHTSHPCNAVARRGGTPWVWSSPETRPRPPTQSTRLRAVEPGLAQARVEDGALEPRVAAHQQHQVRLLKPSHRRVGKVRRPADHM